MAGKFASSTDVPVEKTRAEIESTVRRYGADGYLSGWEGDRAMVQFRAQDRYVRFNMVMPDRSSPEFTIYTRGHGHQHRRTDTAAYAAWEQACRQRWRALLLLVKAKLEAVESGITTFESEFLGNVVTPDGKTFYEHAAPRLAIAYQTGEMPKMLEGF